MSEAPLDNKDSRGETPVAAGGRRRPRLRMVLRSTSALPVLVTLFNGIAGFAAIYYATYDGLGRAEFRNLTTAAWLIFAAMAFDSLDGRLARLTRKTSDFGAQLDSLCDAISFGVAPAVLMLQAVSKALGGEIEHFDILRSQAPALARGMIAIAVIYVCCTVVRLARFNIENAPDVLRHMSFKGLPSPGAAATVASLVLLFDRVHMQQQALWFSWTVGVALPAVTFAVAILMVSRMRYPHLVNQFIVGKRPVSYIIKALVVLVAALLYVELTLAVVTVLFAATGPVNAVRRMVWPEPATPAPAAQGHVLK